MQPIIKATRAITAIHKQTKPTTQRNNYQITEQTLLPNIEYIIELGLLIKTNHSQVHQWFFVLIYYVSVWDVLSVCCFKKYMKLQSNINFLHIQFSSC